MKNYILALTALIFLGCSKDDDSTPVVSNNNPLSVQSTIQQIMQNGKWYIRNFNDSGDDETQNFSGYEFTFNSDSTLVVDGNSSNFSGTWSITDNNSSDDSKDDLDFNINFNLTNNFQDLNDDWDVLSYGTNKIELIDVSGGNGGTDSLTFEKI